jgi:hypothetical protein
MPDIVENSDVIRATALTPDTVPVQETESAPAEVEPAPAEPSADEAEVAQPEEQPAASEDGEQATDQAPAAHAEGETQEPAAKKPARGVQKALDRLAGQRDTAQRERDQAIAIAQQLQRQLQAQQQPPPPQQQPLDPEPVRTGYTDWETFDRARAQWESRQEANRVVDARFQQFGQNIQAATLQQQWDAENYRRAAKISKAVQEAAEKIPEWGDVIASDLPMTQPLYHAIARTDDPARVMLHLAKHPDQHMRLVNLVPEDMAYEMGKIMGLRAAPAKSSAPPPARPVSGKASPSLEYRDDFTPAQHKAWLAKTQRS